MDLLTTKIVYTMIIALCDWMFLLTPFLLGELKQWKAMVSAINLFLGGALLSLSFLSLLWDSTKTLMPIYPTFPLALFCCACGTVFGTFFSKLLEEIKRGRVASETPTTIQLAEQSTTSVVMSFAFVSLFESFMANLILGFQNEASHVIVLSILIMIGDTIQMIILGVALKRQSVFRENRRQHTFLGIYFPFVILLAVTLIMNLAGTFCGIAFVSVLSTRNNAILLTVISESLMAFNAGLFITLSIVEMIFPQINKHDDRLGTTFKKIVLLLLGGGVGTLLSFTMKIFQE
jgi:hypothetical protein